MCQIWETSIEPEDFVTNINTAMKLLSSLCLNVHHKRAEMFAHKARK